MRLQSIKSTVLQLPSKHSKHSKFEALVFKRDVILKIKLLQGIVDGNTKTNLLSNKVV
ncbi:hypothetical protein ITJ86_07535 [Winogradskyella sp. F6397]|uniref:Uncharacterized protein n=1 Tax=Winogradskyella marina TaxID=2785530 RepID=A0ABS0EH67_9FLAO|nr:hypothetical protein [Winogradskyella marina]